MVTPSNFYHKKLYPIKRSPSYKYASGRSQLHASILKYLYGTKFKDFVSWLLDLFDLFKSKLFMEVINCQSLADYQIFL